MRKKSTYFLRLLAICASFLFLQAGILSAQTTDSLRTQLGISWDIPADTAEQRYQLELFELTGIQYLELQHPVSGSELDMLSEFSFGIFIRFDNTFLTATVLSSESEVLKQEFLNALQRYSDYSQIRAYGLYSFSQSFDPDFSNFVELLLQEPRANTNRDFYEITTGPYNATDFSITEISGNSIPPNTVSYLLNKKYNPGDFETVADIFSRKPALFFFDSQWFIEATSNHAEFVTALVEYQENSELILPLLKTEETGSGFEWIIIIYLLIWASVGIHMRIVPTYKSLITRFFVAHRFFVDDFMRYRERTVVSGTFLFIQHAFFTGIMVYLIAVSYISTTGLEALFYYLPQAAIFGVNYVSVFAVTVLITVILQLIGLFWLYLPNKAMNHFSQALTLYTWPLHLDFIFVSIMLIIWQTDGSDILMIAMAILFILNWLTGFLMTSIDSSKYLQQERVKYILYTFGLHLLLNILMLVGLLTSEYLLDLIDLVINI